jgi:hypothetical protein
MLGDDNINLQLYLIFDVPLLNQVAMVGKAITLEEKLFGLLTTTSILGELTSQRLRLLRQVLKNSAASS